MSNLPFPSSVLDSSVLRVPRVSVLSRHNHDYRQGQVSIHNLICIFDTSNRAKLISEMKSVPLADLDDEMQQLLFRVVHKLVKMNDEEFSRCDFAPAEFMDERSE